MRPLLGTSEAEYSYQLTRLRRRCVVQFLYSTFCISRIKGCRVSKSFISSVVDGLERLTGFSFRSAAPFERLNVFNNRSHRMGSRWFMMGLHGTVQKMGTTLDSVQRPGSTVHGKVLGTSVWTRESAWKIVAVPCASQVVRFTVAGVRINLVGSSSLVKLSYRLLGRRTCYSERSDWSPL